MKWEYRYEKAEDWSGIDVMNELGAEGWEYFKVMPRDKIYRSTSATSASICDMWFKRSIE